MTTSLLPPENTTPAERAVEKAVDYVPKLVSAAKTIPDVKHKIRPGWIMEYLVFEYGLEPLRRYIQDLYDLVDKGRQWSLIRGTHKAVYDGLGFIGYQGEIETPKNRRAWSRFQVGLDRLRDTEDDLPDIEGIVNLSGPQRSVLDRVYYGYDVRAADFSGSRHAQSIWSTDSGVKARGTEAKWSFGREKTYRGSFSRADLEALGVWSPEVTSEKWADMNFVWSSADFAWSNLAERSRRAAIAQKISQMPVWLRLSDVDSGTIGFRLACSVPVRASSKGAFNIEDKIYARADDDPTHILIWSHTGFGDGAGQYADRASVVINGDVSALPGKLWREDVTGGVELASEGLGLLLGETVRDKILYLLEI
jgi:hypothetical protein